MGAKYRKRISCIVWQRIKEHCREAINSRVRREFRMEVLDWSSFEGTVNLSKLKI